MCHPPNYASLLPNIYSSHVFMYLFSRLFYFFFQAEDGIRDYKETGVQTCALPIFIVADAKPDTHTPARDAGRAEALIAVTHALNGPTRAALSTLRAGGNRSGADSVATWQTGYPRSEERRVGTGRSSVATADSERRK